MDEVDRLFGWAVVAGMSKWQPKCSSSLPAEQPANPQRDAHLSAAHTGVHQVTHVTAVHPPRQNTTVGATCSAVVVASMRTRTPCNQTRSNSNAVRCGISAAASSTIDTR